MFFVRSEKFSSSKKLETLKNDELSDVFRALIFLYIEAIISENDSPFSLQMIKNGLKKKKL